MSVISMKQLLEAGVHFGHQTRRWNPKMAEYIYTERNGIYIIDLQQSVGMVDDAYNAIADIVADGGSILFVGTKKQAQDAIKTEAERCGQFYVNERWLGGMLTNFKTIQSRIARLKEIETMAADGTFEVLPKKEVIALQDMGHKRLALETGEDPVNIPIEYVLESIKTIYSIKHKNGAIRRVNVNIAATTVENYKKLKDVGIGTYILFQETYHKDNYEVLHPTGPKHDYAYHTEAMDRAMTAGIDDVGIGVLFGLDMYRYDFAGLLMHAEHLEAKFGVGPHTISVPRIRPADDIDPDDFENAINDDIFEKIVAILRIAVPYTGIIVSTRETQESRERVLKVGVSQISGASSTSVGGYAEKEKPEDNSAQFEKNDNRTLDEIIGWLMDLGHIPSFCTACYREGRTGDRFMTLVKSGQIANCCAPNALMTLKEYLEDYASDEVKAKGEVLIKQELEKIPNPVVKQKATEYIENIHEGKRDFRF